MMSAFDCISSGDWAKLEAYVKTFGATVSVEHMMVFHNQTGGIELVAIDSNEPLLITFRVKEKGGLTVAKRSRPLKTVAGEA